MADSLDVSAPLTARAVISELICTAARTSLARSVSVAMPWTLSSMLVTSQ
jgi:hypothetical protein